MRFLGIDYGQRRVGLALSDPQGVLATPLGQLDGRDRDWVLAQLARLGAEHEVAGFVLGLPRNMDGTLGPAARACEELAQVLGRKTGRPVHLVDERLSSVEAVERLREVRVSGRRARERVDRAAAAIILQGFLDSRTRGTPPSDANADPP